MYTGEKSVFEEIEQFGILVPGSDRTYPWFAVYDFEAILKQIQEQKSEKLVWLQKHEAISVSVCSNATGYTDSHCIINPDLDELIAGMLSYLMAISKKGWRAG